MLRFAFETMVSAIVLFSWLSMPTSANEALRAPDSTAIVAKVVRADGIPVNGAVVVTSVGGKGVSGSDGIARVVVDLNASRQTHVTAVAVIKGVNHVGSVRLPLPQHDERQELDAGVIVLTAGSECQSAWVPTFGGQVGMDDRIYAVTSFDDGLGGGPAIYVGGQFVMAGHSQVNRIAKWDGQAWVSLGSGMNNTVWSLSVFDDGSGERPALYAGGDFTAAGGIDAGRIAKWNGVEWAAVGGGTSSRVSALTVFDDGSGNGPALYAGGYFSSAGGVTVNSIAKWDGAQWSALGIGTSGYVNALSGYDGSDGIAPGLYVGGYFSSAGGMTVNSIARWDGASWSPLDTGVAGTSGNVAVYAISTLDDDSGGTSALFVGGSFTSAGGVSANNIAKWDGFAWSALGSGCDDSVRALAVFDDGLGDGPALYAGGTFTSAGDIAVDGMAKWNGLAWSDIGYVSMGNVKRVYVLAVLDDVQSEGTKLYHDTSFGYPACSVNAFDGAEWSSFGDGIDASVLDIIAYDDGLGDGPVLYAAGNFLYVDGKRMKGIAKWDGTEWSPLGDGFDSWVYALAVYDDNSGGGPALYAAGHFTASGGVTAKRVAKWNGESWEPLGEGVTGPNESNVYVYSLAVFDDGLGGGPALYAGGKFTDAGQRSANRIAKWDGKNWTPLGSGVNGDVWVLHVHDDGLGGGPALYAGGSASLAKWDGVTWTSVGGGVSGVGGARVFAIDTFDDGDGPVLYVGGTFSSAGGVEANNIARWDGTAWSAVGTGVNELGISTMAVINELSGPALYVGGRFTVAGGLTANRIAKWDGTTWSTLDQGLNDWVYAMSAFDDGSGEALYVGGFFTHSQSGDSFLAKWECAQDDNDDCSDASQVSDGVTPFENVFATTTGPDEPKHCPYFGDTNIQNDIWFQYQATCTGPLTISTCGSSYSTKLAVYSETCPIGSGEVIACNAAACHLQAEVQVNAVVGDVFLIRIGGHHGAVGTGILTITCDDQSTPGDLNGDGVVDITDLLIMLGAWGRCQMLTNCKADLNNDDIVDVSDLLMLLANWG